MKKANIYLIITIVSILILISVIRYSNRIFRKYKLTDTAKNNLQVYRISTDGSSVRVEQKTTYSGADEVKAAVGKYIILDISETGINGTKKLVPVSKIIYQDGHTVNHDQKREYVLLENLVVK